MGQKITRRFQFDAGHRILNHESKCRFLHGHRYSVDVTVSAPSLDTLGRVVDFGVLKEVLGEWIDENLDHNLILHPRDPLLRYDPDIHGREYFIMPEALANPTAENLARLIYRNAVKCLEHAGSALITERVRIWETPNCWADWSKGDEETETNLRWTKQKHGS